MSGKALVMPKLFRWVIATWIPERDWKGVFNDNNGGFSKLVNLLTGFG